MKCFFKGGLGALLVLIMAGLLIPLYSDYQSRVETAAMIAELAPLQTQIEARLAAQQARPGLGLTSPPFKARVTKFRVSDSGEIMLKGGSNGQMLVLSPIRSEGKVRWQCIGGPDHDMPLRCRK